jgi:hypothetical protein
MQKYALTFRIFNNDQNPSKYSFAYAHTHFQKIRALVITDSNSRDSLLCFISENR